MHISLHLVIFYHKTSLTVIHDSPPLESLSYDKMLFATYKCCYSHFPRRLPQPPTIFYILPMHHNDRIKSSDIVSRHTRLRDDHNSSPAPFLPFPTVNGTGWCIAICWKMYMTYWGCFTSEIFWCLDVSVHTTPSVGVQDKCNSEKRKVRYSSGTYSKFGRRKEPYILQLLKRASFYCEERRLWIAEEKSGASCPGKVELLKREVVLAALAKFAAFTTFTELLLQELWIEKLMAKW